MKKGVHCCLSVEGLPHITTLLLLLAPLGSHSFSLRPALRTPSSPHSSHCRQNQRHGLLTTTRVLLFEKQAESTASGETSIAATEVDLAEDESSLEASTSSASTNEVDDVDDDDDIDQKVSSMAISEAPPLSFQKFLTMQGKRVVVTIRYSGGEAGLKPYFLTAAKKIKASHPDVILERRQMPDVDREDPNDDASFEILVDGKVVVGNTKSRSRKKMATEDVQQSIFVSMQELDLAISRARRRRRPSTTVYGEVHEPNESSSSLRLDGLRQNGDEEQQSAVGGTAMRKNQWND